MSAAKHRQEISALHDVLEEMRNELEASSLEVVLVPQKRRSNEGGMIRVAVNKNAKWYRDLCAANLSSRKRKNTAPDTLIKRAHVLRTLTQLLATDLELVGCERIATVDADGFTVKTRYAQRILDVAALRLRRAVHTAQPF
jgi:hypothetical protein